jgi:ComF family protein
MARFLVVVVGEQGWPIDLIVPVALGPKRERERGFNQAAVLAQPLSWALNKEFNRNVLWRTRETDTQVNLTYRQRLVNVANAFQADREEVNHKNILLVDDVMTSGATLHEASLALKAEGAAGVFAITLSRAAL